MSVQINLDFNQYDKWVSKLSKFSKKLKKAIESGFNEFAERFDDKLRENAIKYGITDPYILENVYYNTSLKNVFSVKINSEQVAYIEYGVGIVGKNNPHPKPHYDWVYDSNNHGNSGWVYPVITESDEQSNDYMFVSNSGDILAWTKGHEPKPFIYDTWLWGTRSLSQIVQKHLRRIKL